jgi:hypothetical protein
MLQEALDRVLRSQCFKNTPSSRRLLSYLAEHVALGDVGQLKEYTVGVDAFGKPTGYDPRQDSTVRIQVGRLRKKLFEYYETEGKDDPWVLVLPKGRFGLDCEERHGPLPPPFAEPEEEAPGEAPAVRGVPWKAVAIGLGVLLLVAVFWRRAPSENPRWSSELAALWEPFLQRPLVVAVGNPLFLQFENKVLYRDPAIEKWDDLLASPNLAAVRGALGNAESRPAYYYAAIGEVNSAFLLGSRLGDRIPSISLVRSSQLQWQQMADSNVLYLGPPRFFRERLGNLPLPLEIVESPGAFKNQHPKPGEQEFYAYRDSAAYFAEDGEAYVLITRAAGPSGNSDILAFASNSTFARVGAVDAFTSPAFVKTIVPRLREGGSSEVPRYFQLLLRVKYKGGVPTESSYVLHRRLQQH